MNYSLSILPEAEEDISRVFNWYNTQKDDLGNRFEEEIDRAMDYIVSEPLSIQIRYAKKIRIHHLNIFPYSIHFVVNGTEIIVLSVLGAKQSPENWSA